jgi:hypothetical protein
MAEAKGHKFGQTLGEWCEQAIEPLLREFAQRHGLYLDKSGHRPARRSKKVKWVDDYGNAHDLDYVFERGGTDDIIGTPVAFIESAWRRYTKHSRNKAQEIQGAVLPLRDRHYRSAPFMGCFLVGVHTAGALEQHQSLGFHLLYFEYSTIIDAFKLVGIDASFGETTSDAEFSKKQKKWQRLTAKKRAEVWNSLLETNRDAVSKFMAALESAVKRKLFAVRIIPLHGNAREYLSIADAITFVRDYNEADGLAKLLRYEIQIRYDNDDRIDAQFQDRNAAIQFLEHYHSGNWMPVRE